MDTTNVILHISLKNSVISTVSIATKSKEHVDNAFISYFQDLLKERFMVKVNQL